MPTNIFCQRKLETKGIETGQIKFSGDGNKVKGSFPEEIWFSMIQNLITNKQRKI